MARRATWIVILALVLMPLLSGGAGPKAFAQDDSGVQTVQTVDGSTTSEETPDDGNATNGNATDGNATDGNVTDGNVTDGNETDGNTSTGNETDGNVTDGNSTDGNATAEPSKTVTTEPSETATIEPTSEPTTAATATTAPTSTKTATPKPTKTPAGVKAAEVSAASVTTSDIVVTINCTGQPERVRVTNNGDASIIVQSIGSIYGASSKEPFTVNKKINAGKTYEWLIGPTASGSNTLYSNYIFTNTAYDNEGASVQTSVGTITKRCPSAPPTKLSDIKVTISCTGDPEKVRVTNNGSQSITVYTIGSLYDKKSYEPFVVNKSISGGGTRAWSAGSGATGNYVLTKSFIFTNSAYDKEGAKVTTSSGDITVRCPAKPALPFGGGKYIEVNLSTQYLIAWQNGERINETYVSTGRPGFDTPTGTWYVNTKLLSQTMSGCIQGECYYVPDVPWVMYFTDWGHALHGTYWHSNFGQTMSHGCVNLPLDFAEWLYYWTPIGTPVVIHY